MGKTIHMALSVDIDRYSDRKLEREFLEMFSNSGVAHDVEGIRRACREARERGQVVFPPCDHVLPNGHCAGHEEAT